METVQTRSETTILNGIRDKILGHNAERYGDVTIITSDNARIPASRMLLAAQSDYFDKLFFSNFKESMTDEIKLDMPSDVVRSLLQYMFTGRSILDMFIDLLKRNSNPKASEKTKLVHPVCQKEDIYVALKLARAADFFLCAQLFDSVVKTLLSMAIQFPYLMCTVFEALYGENALLDEPPFEQCLEILRQSPKNTFLLIPQAASLRISDKFHMDISDFRRCVAAGFGIICLSSRALKEIYIRLVTNTEYLFEALLHWCSKRGERVDGLIAGTEDGQDSKLAVEQEMRKMQAKELASRFSFDEMSAAFVLSFVLPSCLINDEQLVQVLSFHLAQYAK